MSKVGKLEIKTPSGVKCTYQWNVFGASGPKWTLNLDIHKDVYLEIKDDTIKVFVNNEEEQKNLRWLFRVLVKNTVEWVSVGYEKKLIVMWVGYDAKIEWKNLVMKLWYSHPIKYELPKDISSAIEKDPKWNSIITIWWVDKQMVGQTSARIRELKKPEPYKGKWIRYLGEVIKLKAGKTSKK